MISALALLSCLGRGREPQASAVRWFGPVGAVIGLVLAGAWWVAAELWPPTLAAAVVVAIDAALTGMLHLDGLADCGDGLVAPMERARRLEVMRDPSVGAFGMVTVVLDVLLSVTALAAVDFRWWLLPGVWAASRSVAALVMVRVPYARPEGLVSAFRPESGDRPAVAAAVGSLLIVGTVAYRSEGPAGLVTLAVALVGAAGTITLAYRRLGGYTGDVLGAVIVVSQVAALMAAAALPPTLGAP